MRSVAPYYSDNFVVAQKNLINVSFRKGVWLVLFLYRFGKIGDANPVVEVDAVKVVDHQRLFAELTGAFQKLADLHDALRADHDQLRADFVTLQQQVTARNAADLADRLDLRALISSESSSRLANATSLSSSIDQEEAARTSNVQKLTRDLAYVSRVFTTYDGSGFGL